MMSKSNRLLQYSKNIFIASASLAVVGGIVLETLESISYIWKHFRWDLGLPESLGQIIGGLILATFIGFMLSWVTLSLMLLVIKVFIRSRELNVGASLAVIWVFLFVCGGVLIFVVPTWIAIIAATIAVLGPAYVLWMDRQLHES